VIRVSARELEPTGRLWASKHLLAVNHAADVTVFAATREAFLDLVAGWPDRECL
jgi:hypothetical protein